MEHLQKQLVNCMDLSQSPQKVSSRSYRKSTAFFPLIQRIAQKTFQL